MIKLFFRTCLNLIKKYFYNLGRLDGVNWELELSNSCWLDRSWQLPQLETHLLVPAADLGVYVSLADGRPVVTQVRMLNSWNILTF